MSAISVHIPESIRLKAEARAAALGRADLADYIRALVEEDVTGEDFSGPDHLSPRTMTESDALVHEGLESPVHPLSAADWKEMHRQLEDAIARGADCEPH